MTTSEDTELRKQIAELFNRTSNSKSQGRSDNISEAMNLITLHTQKAVIAELKKVERLTRPMLPNSGDPIINIRMWASTRIEQLTNPPERSE